MYCFFELMAWSSSPLHHEMKLIRACTRKCISYNSYVCQRLHPNFFDYSTVLNYGQGGRFLIIYWEGDFWTHAQREGPMHPGPSVCPSTLSVVFDKKINQQSLNS